MHCMLCRRLGVDAVEIKQMLLSMNDSSVRTLSPWIMHAPLDSVILQPLNEILDKQPAVKTVLEQSLPQLHRTPTTSMTNRE